MGIREFFLKLITSHSGVSSKRFCGLIGWFVCLCVLVYCTIKGTEAPGMIDFIILSVLGMLGIDSVTSIWTGKYYQKDDKDKKSTDDSEDDKK